MNILVIGGSGIIGKQLCRILRLRSANVVSLALHGSPCMPNNVVQIEVDINQIEQFRNVADIINQKYGKWDAVIDVIQFGAPHARQVLNCFRDQAKHIIIISSTLVYDVPRSSSTNIREDGPLAPSGRLGGYVDRKLEVELFWRNANFSQWTIIRPYHIVGTGSLLGCVPFHNRDLGLVKSIESGIPLRLVDAGEFPIMFISPADLANFIVCLIGNLSSFGNAYNAAFPESIQAREYYEEVATQLGRPLRIIRCSKEELFESGYGWELTAMPHVYCIDKLMSVSGFIPEDDLQTCISRSLSQRHSWGEISALPEVHIRMNLPPQPLEKFIR